MPTQRIQTYEPDKDAILAAYLRIPRAVTNAQRVSNGTPGAQRHQIYYHAGRLYLVFRKDQNPHLAGHTFRRVFTTPNSPWAVYLVERHPLRLYNIDHLRDGGALERLRHGATVDSLSPEDCRRACTQALQLLTAAERRLAQLDAAPIQDLREAAQLAARLADAEQRRDRAERRLAKSTTTREQELQAQLDALQQNLDAAPQSPEPALPPAAKPETNDLIRELQAAYQESQNKRAQLADECRDLRQRLRDQAAAAQSGTPVHDDADWD